MTIVLARTIAFSPHQDESFFQDLPATAAIFMLRDSESEGEPYVSKTANLRRRLQRLLGRPAEHSRRLNLRDRVSEVAYTPVGSDFESQFLLYRVLRETFPKTYPRRLRLRPAPLVKLHLENEYPRASVTARLGKMALPSRAEKGRSANLYYGPFSSRTAAEKFASNALDFFKMRRCVEDLRPDPTFPGCVYSEMKMCLAPCFKGCTDTEYHIEVARVQSFFDSSGESLVREFSEHRDRASINLAFEEASAIHGKLEKLKPLLTQLPEIVRRIERLKAIIVQPSVEADSVALFHFSAATLAGPLIFNLQPQAESRSMESRIEEVIGSFPSPVAKLAVECMEHLALIKRWYYRSSRVGEVFFAEENGSWPLRRIARGIARVHRGEKSHEPTTFSATESLETPS